MNGAPELVTDGTRMTEQGLIDLLVWDDDEVPAEELASGIYQTCAGAWNRNPDGTWTWWQDPNWIEP